MPLMFHEQPGSVPLASKMPFNPRAWLPVSFQQIRPFKTGRCIACAIRFIQQVSEGPRAKTQKYTVFKIVQSPVGYVLTMLYVKIFAKLHVKIVFNLAVGSGLQGMILSECVSQNLTLRSLQTQAKSQSLGSVKMPHSF